MVLVRPGRFELFRDQNKQYRFRLRASNGLVLLSSKGYRTRRSALTGIESVRKNSTDDARFQREQTTSGYCFDLLAENKEGHWHRGVLQVRSLTRERHCVRAAACIESEDNARLTSDSLVRTINC